MKTILQVNEQMFRILLARSGLCECFTDHRIEIMPGATRRAFNGASKGAHAEVRHQRLLGRQLLPALRLDLDVQRAVSQGQRAFLNRGLQLHAALGHWNEGLRRG